jgi:hypothetical protein
MAIPFYEKKPGNETVGFCSNAIAARPVRRLKEKTGCILIQDGYFINPLHRSASALCELHNKHKH